MNGEKRFVTLKTKIIASTLLPVVLSLALISVVHFVSLFGSLDKTAKSEFLQISQKYAYSFESKVNSAMNYLAILASELEVRVEAGSTGRETLQKTILKIFDEYKLVDGSSVYFEADRYDGMDAEYRGSQYGTENSGRICWYFYKDEGETAYLPEGLSDDIEFELPHYTLAREANKPIYTDPVVHEVDGKHITMFTLTYPINDSNGEFIGAVTVDLFLDDIYTPIQNEKIYETGYVMIANDNGKVIYCPRYEDIGKTRQEAGLVYPLPSGSEAPEFFNSRSIVNDKPSLVTISTIYIPQLDSNFYISVTAPLDEINADGTQVVAALAILALLVVTSIGFLLYFLIGKISAPLNEITESVNRIANGDYEARITGDYKGEYSVVKTSVNLMAASIEAYISESEGSLNILKNILNGLDASIYVTVPDTGEILFINDFMKEHYGIDSDGVGQICYKVLQDGIDDRCDFCPCRQLDHDTDAVIVWEEHSTLTKRHYRNTDRYIEWMDGQKVHLQHSVDLTDIKVAQAALDRRLRQQSLMAAISKSFLSDAHIETLITNALRMTGEFLALAQILYFKFEDDGRTFTCQNEWINPQTGKQSFVGNSQVIESSLISVIKSLAHSDKPYLDANDPLLETEMSKYMVNFQNYITVPIFLKGELYGALDCFMENNDKQWSDSDISLAILVSSLLSGVLERHLMESELIAAKDMAEQGSRSKSEFLSRMSHEMRTPMNAIIGMTGIAMGSDDPERKDYCLDKIDGASKHLLGVINDILDMSKIEANKFELSPAEFVFEKMLQKVVNVNTFRIDEKQQQFTVNIDHKIPRSLIGDDQRIAQIITNLLSNAVKFTPERGSLRLDTHLICEEDDICTLQIEVTDTGIGISPEQQERIFTSFEQAENSTSRKFGGTGLGLAISKSIVEMMGGRIWIESELGKGATFAFTIQMRRGEEKHHSLLGPGVTWENIRVLAVDDIPEICEYFKDIAERFGIACDTAESGEEAIALIESRGEYDIYFVDWKMPGMDGIELSRHIKKNFSADSVIIMISATEWNVIELDARNAGVDKFLFKPLFPSAIADCINECLGLGAAMSEVKAPEDEADCFKGYRVLLAEDVDINREIVMAMLEPTALEIDCAENGVEAVQMFRNAPDLYDLIFMDVQMPEMDGYEASRCIRETGVPRANDIPIIAMTANVFREDVERCLAAGMNAHVGKPLAVDELFEVLRKYLGAARPE